MRKEMQVGEHTVSVVAFEDGGGVVWACNRKGCDYSPESHGDGWHNGIYITYTDKPRHWWMPWRRSLDQVIMRVLEFVAGRRLAATRQADGTLVAYEVLQETVQLLLPEEA